MDFFTYSRLYRISPVPDHVIAFVSCNGDDNYIMII